MVVRGKRYGGGTGAAPVDKGLYRQHGGKMVRDGGGTGAVGAGKGL